MATQTADIKLPKVKLNIYTPKNPVVVPVVENWVATKSSSPNFIRHIAFDISGTELEGNIEVGQAFGILPPGKTENGRPHKLRLYSLASPRNREGDDQAIVSTTVKRVIEEWEDEGLLYLGVCSNYLCNLKPGDEVKMTGPSGRRFLLPENRNDFNYLFFAAGTGMAPFRGMVLDLLENGFDNQITLVFGCPYRTDILYYELFTKLEEQYDNFNFITCISREDRRPDGTKKYVQTSIVDHSSALHPLLKKSNTLVYICGLKGMETGIYQTLASQGFSEYLVIDDAAQHKDPKDWDEKDFKRNIKPSNRMFVEVY